MTSSTLKWLAIATVTLLIVMIAVDRTDRSDTVAGGEYLVPGLKERINDVTAISVTGAGEGPSVNIIREGDGWQVREKDGFAADVGELRKILIALGDARRLEQKTANPERYAQLGVAGPDAGNGILVEISGSDFRHGVIIGNAERSKYRYVRLVDDEQSWLIDQNPDLPDDTAGWLAADLLDIEAARIRSVSIRHADGETIRLEKQAEADSNYTVLDIPEGRELSYATVANGIAGVLKGLTLEDVRRLDAEGLPGPDTSDSGSSDIGALEATAVFTTFEGLEITARRYQDGESAWITFAAAALPAEEPVSETQDAIGEETSDDAAADESTAAADAVSPAEEAQSINARHAGWQYRVPDYKANLLARRWADILKAEE